MYEPPPPDMVGTFNQGPQLPPRDTNVQPKRLPTPHCGPILPPRRRSDNREEPLPVPPPSTETLRPPSGTTSKERTPSPSGGRGGGVKKNYVDVVPKQKPPGGRPPIPTVSSSYTRMHVHLYCSVMTSLSSKGRESSHRYSTSRGSWVCASHAFLHVKFYVCLNQALSYMFYDWYMEIELGNI